MQQSVVPGMDVGPIPGGGLKNEDQRFADLGSGGYSFTMVRALYGGGREHAQRLIAGSFHRVPSQDDF